MADLEEGSRDPDTLLSRGAGRRAAAASEHHHDLRCRGRPGTLVHRDAAARGRAARRISQASGRRLARAQARPDDSDVRGTGGGARAGRSCTAISSRATCSCRSDGLLKILDFGVARFVDSSMTAAGTMLGTPDYMSPEQARGAPVDARSDIFSAGAVFYFILAGRKPFGVATCRRCCTSSSTRSRRHSETACPVSSRRSCLARWPRMRTIDRRGSRSCCPRWFAFAGSTSPRRASW